MFVELHMIQNFGPSCLNRDDTNTPKDCQFGGFRRARISSQCLKRAIRTHFNQEIDEFKGKLGIRTKLLPKKIVDILVDKGKDKETSIDTVHSVLNDMDFKNDKKTQKTEVLLFLNRETPQQFAELILSEWDSLTKEKLSKTTLKKFDPIIEQIKNDLNVDIALFGRMVASKAVLTLDAASYVAHALSTHKVDMEMDFYTAIDDLQEQEESGAGMMGIIIYNSSCFYRYSVLDADQLKSNLNGNSDLTLSVLKGFIEASINAIPTGKQTSMAAFNKPDFIMATVRTDQPWSLINAYVRPVKVTLKNDNIISQSIQYLDVYLKNMMELYGRDKDLKIYYCHTGERKLDYLSEEGIHYSNIQQLIDNIGEAINGSFASST
ncbi:CRISPR system Cascade subunit CasC [subsurface metagenome]